MGLRVGIISPCEVPIVTGDNRVLLPFLDVLTVPLSDAGATRVGEHQPPYLLQGFILSEISETGFTIGSGHWPFSVHGHTSLSLVMVALICSDPGVTVKEDLDQKLENQISIILSLKLVLRITWP